MCVCVCLLWTGVLSVEWWLSAARAASHPAGREMCGLLCMMQNQNACADLIWTKAEKNMIYYRYRCSSRAGSDGSVGVVVLYLFCVFVDIVWHWLFCVYVYLFCVFVVILWRFVVVLFLSVFFGCFVSLCTYTLLYCTLCYLWFEFFVCSLCICWDSGCFVSLCTYFVYLWLLCDTLVVLSLIVVIQWRFVIVLCLFVLVLCICVFCHFV